MQQTQSHIPGTTNCFPNTTRSDSYTLSMWPKPVTKTHPPTAISPSIIIKPKLKSARKIIEETAALYKNCWEVGEIVQQVRCWPHMQSTSVWIPEQRARKKAKLSTTLTNGVLPLQRFYGYSTWARDHEKQTQTISCFNKSGLELRDFFLYNVLENFNSIYSNAPLKSPSIFTSSMQ